MADTADLKSSEPLARAGSTPASGTTPFRAFKARSSLLLAP